jgi:transposase
MPDMLTLPPSVRIFVCLTPADMRRSLDGLAALTREVLLEDPLSGHLFVFFNRRRNRTKILFFDRSGLCLLYKRIEKGVFRLAALERGGRQRAEVEAVELALILEGSELADARRRKRWTPGKTA